MSNEMVRCPKRLECGIDCQHKESHTRAEHIEWDRLFCHSNCPACVPVPEQPQTVGKFKPQAAILNKAVYPWSVSCCCGGKIDQVAKAGGINFGFDTFCKMCGRKCDVSDGTPVVDKSEQPTLPAELPQYECETYEDGWQEKDEGANRQWKLASPLYQQAIQQRDEATRLSDYWKMMYENLTKQLNHAVKNAPYYIGKK